MRVELVFQTSCPVDLLNASRLAPGPPAEDEDRSLGADDHLVVGHGRRRPCLVQRHTARGRDAGLPPLGARDLVDGVQVAGPVRDIDRVRVDGRGRRHVTVRREGPLGGEAGDVCRAQRVLGRLVSGVLPVPAGRVPFASLGRGRRACQQACRGEGSHQCGGSNKSPRLQGIPPGAQRCAQHRGVSPFLAPARRSRRPFGDAARRWNPRVPWPTLGWGSLSVAGARCPPRRLGMRCVRSWQRLGRHPIGWPASETGVEKQPLERLAVPGLEPVPAPAAVDDQQAIGLRAADGVDDVGGCLRVTPLPEARWAENDPQELPLPGLWTLATRQLLDAVQRARVRCDEGYADRIVGRRRR